MLICDEGKLLWCVYISEEEGGMYVYPACFTCSCLYKKPEFPALPVEQVRQEHQASSG